MDTPKPYQYRRLKGSDAIRLIVLHPALELGDPVKCDLIHTSLTECEEDIIDHYTAISYVWGDQNDTVGILVDGHCLDITASLDSALRHLRSWNRYIRLWADAICINQTDIDERNHQVRQMGAIYACALHTVIYFGTSIPEAELILETLRTTNANRRKGTPDAYNILNFNSEVRQKALTHLLTQPWLTRIWVLQEVIFSRDPWIQCGAARLRWEDFCTFVESSRLPPPYTSQPTLPYRKSIVDRGFVSRPEPSNSHQSRDSQVSKGRDLLLGMSKFRSSFYDASTSPYGHRLLMQLLRFRRGLGVTDPRDMIFAHTIIARNAEMADKNRDLVTVDYSKGCSEIYREIARYFIKEFKDFSILSEIEDIELDHRHEGMVSWAPDWTRELPPLPWTHLESSYFSYRESYLWQNYSVSAKYIYDRWTIPSKRTFGWVESTLSCIGTKVGVVENVGQVIIWPLSYFNIERFFRDRTGDTRLPSSLSAKFYEQLWNNVDVELGPGILPDLTRNASEPGTDSVIHDGDMSMLSEIHRTIRNHLDNVVRCWRRGGTEPTPTQYILVHLVKDTLLHKTSSILHGRRLTALSDGTLALVPSSAHPGDVIACFAGSEIPYLLRKCDAHENLSDADIRSIFVAAEELEVETKHDCRGCKSYKSRCDLKQPICGNCRRRGQSTDDCTYDNIYDVVDLHVGHYKFIGECFVETLMYGWTAQALEEREKMIFAVH